MHLGDNWKVPLNERTKRLETSKLFMKQREEGLARITSEAGSKLRMNRSIQVEGSFRNIKQDMGFRRYMCRGKVNVGEFFLYLLFLYPFLIET